MLPYFYGYIILVGSGHSVTTTWTLSPPPILPCLRTGHYGMAMSVVPVLGMQAECCLVQYTNDPRFLMAAYKLS